MTNDSITDKNIEAVPHRTKTRSLSEPLESYEPINKPRSLSEKFESCSPDTQSFVLQYTNGVKPTSASYDADDALVSTSDVNDMSISPGTLSMLKIYGISRIVNEHK